MWIVRTDCRDVRRNLAVEEWLLDRAEVATRAAVAERLAGYSETPSQVAEKLSRDEIAVAAPIKA